MEEEIKGFWSKKYIIFLKKLKIFRAKKYLSRKSKILGKKNIFGENSNFCAKKYRFEKKWEALHCISEKNGSQITNNVITNLTF